MDIKETENPAPISSSSLAESEIWKKSLDTIKKELSEQSFKTWIEPTRLNRIEVQQAFIEVPDKFYGDWLKDHYNDIIKEALADIIGYKPEISYLVKPKTLNNSSSTPKFHSPQSPHLNVHESTGLNERYTFQNFVIGPGNRFAHAASVAVSEAPAKNYNPLFIYGRVGLGKTHLMQAIAISQLEKNPKLRVTYISGEKFTNQLITSIQNRSTQNFRTKYRNTDILLVDDIHFIAGKESTQEEFFHTFNALYDAHKQIVVTSDRPPKEIPGLEDRLISRFGWGLVADIQPPDFETRVAILKKKMEKETVMVPDDVVYLIASKIKNNIRELEGALIRVVAYASLTGGIITKKVVEEEVLRDSIKEEMTNITIDRIQKAVCDYFNLKLTDLRVKKRSRSIAHPRQMAMYLVRSLTDHSLPEIGSYFGGRGHATVIHACNKIDVEIKTNIRTRTTIEEIKTLINEV